MFSFLKGSKVIAPSGKTLEILEVEVEVVKDTAGQTHNNISYTVSWNGGEPETAFPSAVNGLAQIPGSQVIK